MYTSFFSLHVKSFLTTGILGGFTTYSTFAIESFFLLQSGTLFLGFVNMGLNLFGTVLMAGGGFYLAELIIAPLP
jgi:CrcB protein